MPDLEPENGESITVPPMAELEAARRARRGGRLPRHAEEGRRVPRLRGRALRAEPGAGDRPLQGRRGRRGRAGAGAARGGRRGSDPTRRTAVVVARGGVRGRRGAREAPDGVRGGHGQTGAPAQEEALPPALGETPGQVEGEEAEEGQRGREGFRVRVEGSGQATRAMS